FLLFLCLGDHLHLHSFPTRRSSDLIRAAHGDIIVRLDAHTVPPVDFISRCVKALEESGWNAIVGGRWRILPSTDSAVARAIAWRSEEHTSELQSREKLVCRLLLEKK